MTSNDSSSEQRVLLVAPVGADAANLCQVLQQAGLAAAACPNLSALVLELASGCGAILLTEEALNYSRARDLSTALDRQPPWSDLPLVLIVTGGHASATCTEAIRLLGSRGNLTLVERPVRSATLLSTLQVALRARQRQYEFRQLLRERDELLASLEARVTERTARLAELNSELEAFSYSVSHDLRAPLRSLERYARILCEDFKDNLPDEGRHYAERIAKNAEKMDRLTRDVLTLSRVTRGEVSLDIHDLDAVVPDVIDQYPDLAAAYRHIQLRSPLGRVLGHHPLLTQCFSNLLHNALKFIPPDRTPEIKVFSERLDGRVRVSVQDNGVGIAPAHHQKIFGIFERASPLNVPGTGIGLAIVKKAVERMGGRIGVESALDAGARFWVDLLAAPELRAQA